MNLDVSIRGSLAERALGALREAVPGSIAELTGSLAGAQADQYSDIDLLWEVPDGDFVSGVSKVEDILSEVQPVESLRSDPDFQNSNKRRVIFVQFTDMPLFWRVDIEIFARSIQRDHNYDLRNESARGSDWSPYHSALMNAIAAIKALLRKQPQTASALIERAFSRVDIAVPDAGPRECIGILLHGVVKADSQLGDLAERINGLYHEAFDSGSA